MEQIGQTHILEQRLMGHGAWLLSSCLSWIVQCEANATIFRTIMLRLSTWNMGILRGNSESRNCIFLYVNISILLQCITFHYHYL